MRHSDIYNGTGEFHIFINISPSTMFVGQMIEMIRKWVAGNVTKKGIAAR